MTQLKVFMLTDTNHLTVSTPLIHVTRLHTPTGWLLLGLPGSWLLLTQKHSVLFWCAWWLGSLCARSAGCIINDWCDQDIDRHVTRTQHRPLALGILGTPYLCAALIACALIGYGAAWYLGGATMIYGASACIPWIMLYPLAKRILIIPQLFLAPVFASSVWMAHLLVPTPHAWLWYTASLLWILGYDTVYALADLEDDLKLPIHSAPKTLKHHTLSMVLACYFGFLSLIYVLLPPTNMASSTLYLSLVFLFLMQFYWISKKKPLTAFRSNLWVGLGVACLVMIHPEPHCTLESPSPLRAPNPRMAPFQKH